MAQTRRMRGGVRSASLYSKKSPYFKLFGKTRRLRRYDPKKGKDNTENTIKELIQSSSKANATTRQAFKHLVTMKTGSTRKIMRKFSKRLQKVNFYLKNTLQNRFLLFLPEVFHEEADKLIEQFGNEEMYPGFNEEQYRLKFEQLSVNMTGFDIENKSGYLATLHDIIKDLLDDEDISTEESDTILEALKDSTERCERLFVKQMIKAQREAALKTIIDVKQMIKAQREAALKTIIDREGVQLVAQKAAPGANHASMDEEIKALESEARQLAAKVEDIDDSEVDELLGKLGGLGL